MIDFFPISPALFAKLSKLEHGTQELDDPLTGTGKGTPYVLLELTEMWQNNDVMWVFVSPDPTVPGAFAVQDDEHTISELGLRGVEFAGMDDPYYEQALPIVVKHGVMGFGRQLVIANVAAEDVSEAVLRLAACMSELDRTLL